jgi:tetratricopeptide (TPR) repeat protein
MAENPNQELQRTRTRVERALASGSRGPDVIGLLEELLHESEEGGADALFAHRQLAELHLETAPWTSALHLRQLVLADVADDGVHALMGLCQALLGNYRAAISSYRRAITLSPRNPWYHHNLGHLLDVGVGEAEAAVHHLRLAHEIETEEDEITASLAHCLARLGELGEARAMARDALDGAPDNEEHRALLDWVEAGAPRERERQGGRRRRDVVTSPGAPTRAAMPDQVARLIAVRMREAGFTREYVERAQALWGDFCGGRALRSKKPAVYAAAIEYAIARVDEKRDVTQAELARRYGVAAGSISSRYGEIRNTLALVPGDPRYS